MKKEIKPIAYIQNDFTSKFGIPRQSGLSNLLSTIIFEKEFSDSSALKGIEGFSHLWLIWGFSQNEEEKKFSPTVRPPRLGGNKRVGVFASRSPFRPNGLGLSSVCLKEVKKGALVVEGADLMNGTPIYDIKPYVPYSDCHPTATSGFSVDGEEYRLRVNCDALLLDKIPKEKQEALLQVLSCDPRPAYQEEGRNYGFAFAGFEIKFVVKEGVLTVLEIEKE